MVSPTPPRTPFGPILCAAATALRAHAHVDAERWALMLEDLAAHATLPTVASPAVLDLLSGFVELARLPEVSAEALRPGSGESVANLAELLRLRNALLSAAAVLLDALHGKLPVSARLN